MNSPFPHMGQLRACVAQRCACNDGSNSGEDRGPSDGSFRNRLYWGSCGGHASCSLQGAGIDNAARMCCVPGCTRERWALGYCSAHWGHNRRHGHPTIKKPSICVPCHVVGCGRSARKRMKTATPVCMRHESVFRRYGEIRTTRPAKIDDAALLAAGAKVCTQCQEERPLDHFIRRKNPIGAASIFVSQCNGCRTAEKRARRAAAGAVPRVVMAERARAKAAAMAEEKARAQEVREERRRHEREQARVHGPMCRLCGERKPAEMFWRKGKCKACELAEFKRRVECSDESYVRRLMAKNSPVLKGSDIPLGLVQVKQLELQIKRYIKTNGGSV